MAQEVASLIRHDIDVSNMLYGSAHFMALQLAPEWEIAPGVGRPEIVAAHKRGQRMWIVTGKAWYVLYHKQLGWALELCLEANPQRRKSIVQPDASSGIAVHGHPALVRRWQQQRGLFRPNTITFVEVTFDCEHSERRLRLELSGRCPPEGFEAVMSMIPAWRCH
ncbi:MAG: hypothetical protein JXB30_12640 [Anaerolineae bacterium]|nr:hypothetical protein [Anaerolineae bacterium]